MNINEAKEKLMQLQSKMSAYQHAMALLSFDEATIAPPQTGENRAHTISVLTEEAYLITTGRETVELLEYLDTNRQELNEEEQRMVYLLLKDIRRKQCIPMAEYVEYSRLLASSYGIWREAKINSDFEAFYPTLQKIFDTQKKFAAYCAPGMHPYDYWLGEYENGLTMEKCDAFFDALKKEIVPLVKKISAAKQIDTGCIQGYFPLDKQAELTMYLMKLMKVDLGHCNALTTEHPFTTEFGSHRDVRITTHYLENDFTSSMFTVIHESGHALYDMSSKDEYAYTVLDGGVSMGVHESQSRFYENYIGRSRSYAEYVFPKLCELFPQLKEYTAEDFWKAINKVEPSLIRTEADEVTYSLHVMVRYELEKRIMSDELEVKDLPAEWNRLYKEYLGVDVPDDRRGVLQDSHWSGGSIGYFPSYALGGAYGAEFLAEMKKTVDVEKCIKEGDFTPVNEWNREHIWKYGCRYTPDTIIKNILGRDFTPKAYTDYLREKYTAIYGLE